MKPAKSFSPRRGRPTAEQGAAINAAILEAAKQLFLEEGFEPVSMISVAQLAGVSTSTLYSRYPTKKELFESFARASIARWAAAPLRRDSRMTSDIAGRLRFHAYSLVSAFADPEIVRFGKVMQASTPKFPELNHVVYATGQRYIVDLITSDIEAAALRDNIPVKNSTSVAEFLVAGISGWFNVESSVREVPAEEIGAYADRCVELILASRPSW